MKIILALMIVVLAGCARTDITEYTKALVESKRCFCGIINAGPYGGGTIAAASPDCSASVSASGCTLEGANVTRVTVPVGSIGVTPMMVPTAPVK